MFKRKSIFKHFKSCWKCL